GDAAAAAAVAERFGVPHWTTDLTEALRTPEAEAVILATPTPLHVSQAIRCLEAGKAVQVEIPLADNLVDAERVAAAARRAGRVAMCSHTRRFNLSHAWLHQRFRTGELTLRQLSVETYFLRRENLNAFGEPRSWTDHLLWHHAAHTVDLFAHQAGEAIS